MFKFFFSKSRAKDTKANAFAIAIAVLSVLSVVSCSTPRMATQVVHEVSHDTIYLSNIQYDSIYVYQGLEKDYRRDLHQPSTLNPQLLVDTVYVKDVSVEYRYKLLRDTVRIVQRDSIPYEVTIVQTKEITRPLTWYDHLTRLTFWLLIGALVTWLVLKIKRLKL